MKLHVLQAEQGDCLLLEAEKGRKKTYVLIDGGPEGIFNKYLHKYLGRISKKGSKLDLIIVSHVCNDHVTGVLDLIAESRYRQFIRIDEMWYNSFDDTIGSGADIEKSVRNYVARARILGQPMPSTQAVLEGIRRGRDLRLAAQDFGIKVNYRFPKKLVTAPRRRRVGILKLDIVGPTTKSLLRLQKKWEKWVREELKDPQLAARADTSIENLSSIMVLASIGKLRVLLTGDGLGKDLVMGLDEADLLDNNDSIHVDVLKVPHHGSERNVTQRFFRKVTADIYVISAKHHGRTENPDLNTLSWIAESIRSQGRPAEIVVTNNTSAIQALQRQFPPEKYGYTLKAIKPGASSIVVELGG